MHDGKEAPRNTDDFGVRRFFDDAEDVFFEAALLSGSATVRSVDEG